MQMEECLFEVSFCTSDFCRGNFFFVWRSTQTVQVSPCATVNKVPEDVCAVRKGSCPGRMGHVHFARVVFLPPPLCAKDGHWYSLHWGGGVTDAMPTREGDGGAFCRLHQLPCLAFPAQCDPVSVSFSVPSSDYRLRLAGHVNSSARRRQVSPAQCFQSTLRVLSVVFAPGRGTARETGKGASGFCTLPTRSSFSTCLCTEG